MKVSFEHVSVRYRRRLVAEDVTFTAHSGVLTALVGRNGAGKSTLLSCLSGEKRDYTGAVMLDGTEVRQLSADRRSRTVAILPQNLPRPHVTVRELAAFGRAPYLPLSGRQSDEDRSAVRRALEAVELDTRGECFVDELSGGERKKAFFAMVLAQDTPVVALDEPTAHLDVVSRFAFLDLLEKLRRETGKTFLVVMHELPEVLRRAENIVVLHERRVVYRGGREGFLAEEIPQRCFGVAVSGNGQTGYALRPLQKNTDG